MLFRHDQFSVYIPILNILNILFVSIALKIYFLKYVCMYVCIIIIIIIIIIFGNQVL